ncbi:hypothetical protein ACIOJD_04775 [Streptomyces sp. NPDC088116]|uniref:hypothetical protein n=1 Tax=Streptomyces sp. NPDC088116 TaxID=3365825 RepID=UPI0038186825
MTTGGSAARELLALLIARFGAEGALLIKKADPGAESPDLAPGTDGSAWKWPACRCGSLNCPDYEPPAVT